MAIKKRAKYTSKGERTARKLSIPRDPITTELDKWDSFLLGKKVFFTIDNPNPNNTKERKIRVEGKDLYGDFRKYRDRHVIR